MSEPDFDVAVIGAGVVGAAIAQHLSHHELRVTLLEAGPDVGAATSKANTAILHTGFDATPGTLEARLVARGYQLLWNYGPRVGIAIERLGALLVAWDEDQLAALDGLAGKARANGYGLTRSVSPDELRAREPHLGPGALGALEVPDESIIDPWSPPLAFATEAVLNGATLQTHCRVTGADRGDAATGHHLSTSRGPVSTRWVVNAAGLYSDEIDRLFGHNGFTVTPRRGELIVFDKLARQLVSHILLPVPTKMGKGVLVSPTVFGNVMLGPTAEDLPDKQATGTTAAGLASLLDKGGRILPALLQEQVTALYAGLRAATEHADFQIALDSMQRYVCVGGIRSTGLTASMAIAEHVGELLAEAGLALRPKPAERLVEPRLPNLGEAFLRPYQDAARIAADRDYGDLVCHCERVSRAEVRDALASTIPPCTLDGLRRRTRVLMGRCQGFYCQAEVTALAVQNLGWQQ